ncbi:hypothetical protein LguiA_026486 [Lonicera macranthoides]
MVTGLPPSASWQDLKVSICFNYFFILGMRGIVDYANYDDMRSRNMIEDVATQGVPVGAHIFQ